MYNSIVHDHLCDTRLPTFETLSFFAYWPDSVTRCRRKISPVTFDTSLAFLKNISVLHLKFSNRWLMVVGRVAVQEWKFLSLSGDLRHYSLRRHHFHNGEKNFFFLVHPETTTTNSTAARCAKATKATSPAPLTYERVFNHAALF